MPTAKVGDINICYEIHGCGKGEERANIENFGDEHKRYMERVPRMNFLVGVMSIIGHLDSRCSTSRRRMKAVSKQLSSMSSVCLKQHCLTLVGG